MEIVINFIVGLFSSLAASNVGDSAKGLLAKIRRPFLPRKTVRFVPNMRYGCQGDWGNGEVRGEPAMCLHSKWYVTNMTEESVHILRAYLVKPKTEATMVLTKHPAKNIFGSYPIMAGGTTEVDVDFWIQPPIGKEGEYFQGKIVFIDQFNNKYKVNARFAARKREVEQILSIKWRPKWQDELNNNLLPKAIRKKLDGKKILLSHDSEISILLKSSEWTIDDDQKPSAVYSAEIMSKKINLCKRLISNEEYKGAAKIESNRLAEELIVSIEPNSKCPDELNNNLLSQELSDVLEQIGELLSHISAISLIGSEWIIGNAQQPRMVYTAEVMSKKVSVYKRFISDEEHI